ncbi:MAG: DUF6340 family protein [Myxococcota bacterium]
MTWLLGTLACVPRVHIEWSTSPELPFDEPLRFEVVDETEHPAAATALTATLSAARRLGTCAADADARVRIERLTTEERVAETAPSAERVRYVVPDLDGGQQVVEADARASWALASWQGRVHLGWTVERCDGSLLETVDLATVADTRSASAATVERARGTLTEDPLEQLVRSSGHALGRRLVPTRGRVSRRWFRMGDPRLQLAAAAVRVGHWDAAAATWNTIVTDPDSTVRARARAYHDLAVHHEVRGQYSRAWRAIRAAEATSATPAILRYRQALEQTWTEGRTLRKYKPLELEEAASP